MTGSIRGPFSRTEPSARVAPRNRWRGAVVPCPMICSASRSAEAGSRGQTPRSGRMWPPHRGRNASEQAPVSKRNLSETQRASRGDIPSLRTDLLKVADPILRPPGPAHRAFIRPRRLIFTAHTAPREPASSDCQVLRCRHEPPCSSAGVAVRSLFHGRQEQLEFGVVERVGHRAELYGAPAHEGCGELQDGRLASGGSLGPR